MEYIPIAISVLSIVIAGTALFITQLRGSKFSIHAGPTIKIYYPSDGGFATYIPITFINYGARMGVIYRAAISLQRSDSPQERYFMEWGSFSTFDPQSGSWRYESMAHALAVPGKAATNKLIWFNWLPSSTPSINIREGEYSITIHYWFRKSGKPKSDTHKIHISQHIYMMLESLRSAKNSATIDVVMDKELDKNKVMTQKEAKSLLGV